MTDEAAAVALEEIEYFVESLDFARDLCKLGGMQALLSASRHARDVEFRWFLRVVETISGLGLSKVNTEEKKPR